jgi:hypothetical protein
MWLIRGQIAYRALIGGVLVWAGTQVSPARASQYDVTFTGTAFDLSAVITTSSTIDSLGGYDVTNVTGTVTGPTSGAVIGLIANPGQPEQGTYYAGSYGWNYDNVLFTTGVAPVDNNGILLSFGSGILANLYSVGSTFYLSVDDPTEYWNPGDVGSLQVSPAPIPESFLLFATGLGLIGFIGWRRQRQTETFLGA